MKYFEITDKRHTTCPVCYYIIVFSSSKEQGIQTLEMRQIYKICRGKTMLTIRFSFYFLNLRALLGKTKSDLSFK